MSDFIIVMCIMLAVLGLAARKAAKAANSPLGQAVIGHALKRLK